METTARTIYTNQDWEKDYSFKAQQGQEIEESIYWSMLDGITPRIYKKHYLTITKPDHLEDRIAIYFLMGECYDHNGANNSARYMLFIKYNNKYYYGGLIEVDQVKVTRRIESIIKSL